MPAERTHTARGMMARRDRATPPGRRATGHGQPGHRLPHPRPRALRRDEPAPGTYHHGERARALLRRGMERHGCATTRPLANKLGVPHGPGLLTAIGYRGDAPAACQKVLRVTSRDMPLMTSPPPPAVSPAPI